MEALLAPGEDIALRVEQAEAQALPTLQALASRPPHECAQLHQRTGTMASEFSVEEPSLRARLHVSGPTHLRWVDVTDARKASGWEGLLVRALLNRAALARYLGVSRPE